MTAGSLFGRPEQWTNSAFSLDEIDDPASEGSPAISIRSLRTALRRRRRFWVTTALIGMLLGAALHTIVPTKDVAVARLYLLEPAVGQPGQAMQDDLGLLQTQAVVDRTKAILSAGGEGTPVLSAYKGSVASPSIMLLKVDGSSPAAAVAEGNALAAAFFSVRSGIMNQQLQIVVKGIQSQISSLNSQIQQLTAEIADIPFNATGSQGSQRASLVNQLNGVAAQLSQQQTGLQQQQATTGSLNQGSRVLDPPRYQPASRKKTIVKDGLAGLVGGLVLGMMVVAIAALLSDRVRRRADIAALLGAPVELSVGRMPRPRWFARPRLRRELPASAARITAYRTPATGPP